MSRNHYEEIKASLCFHSEIVSTSNDNRWSEIKPFISLLNDRWFNMIHPGYKITIDESLFQWYGKGGYCKDGTPAVMKIHRKLRGVGCEVKNATDSVTNIMISVKVNEGNDTMLLKKW